MSATSATRSRYSSSEGSRLPPSASVSYSLIEPTSSARFSSRASASALFSALERLRGSRSCRARARASSLGADRCAALASSPHQLVEREQAFLGAARSAPHPRARRRARSNTLTPLALARASRRSTVLSPMPAHRHVDDAHEIDVALRVVAERAGRRAGSSPRRARRSACRRRSGTAAWSAAAPLRARATGRGCGRRRRALAARRPAAMRSRSVRATSSASSRSSRSAERTILSPAAASVHSSFACALCACSITRARSATMLPLER